MTLNPVESSNIKAVGYDADRRLLRVEFRDGATYDYNGVAADTYANFLSADSKGRFLHQFRRGARVDSPGPASAEHLALDTFDEDECCGDPLVRAIRSGALRKLDEWACPKCGCEWSARAVGPVRHWSPQTAILIFRS